MLKQKPVCVVQAGFQGKVYNHEINDNNGRQITNFRNFYFTNGVGMHC